MNDEQTQKDLASPKLGLFARLKQIQIEAPEDFAMNLDVNLSRGSKLDKTITAEQAKQHLMTMLQTTRINPEQPDMQQFVAVYKQFCQIKFVQESENDALLFEYSPPYQDEPGYYVGFIRQFSFNDEEGEYDHMEQMKCKFFFLATEELAQWEGNRWSFAFDNDFDHFLSTVEAMPVFQSVSKLLPIKVQYWASKI